MRKLALLLMLWSVALPATPQTARRRTVRSPGMPPAPSSFIDVQLNARMARDGVVPAPLAGDAEFLRRVSVDLTGTIPLAADAEAFLADTSADKRARKIDELLRSAAFTDRWTLWFGDLVQNVQVSQNSREYYLGRNAYYEWIRDSIASGKPYDAMVREVLAGEGASFQSGVANYIVRQIQPNGPVQDTYDNLAAHSAEKFLGLPALCISCHNGRGHLESVNWYLSQKSREDFWKMAAFFARTGIRGERYTDPANPNVNVFQYTINANPNGAYRANTTDGNKSPRQVPAGTSPLIQPAFLLTGEQPRPGEPLRAAYGRMLTADRQFARATVNLLWKEMFGRAFVEPVNAFDLSKLDSQPTHPALLEALASEFIARNYSLRDLLRAIALSDGYQRATAYTGTAPADTYFARRVPKRLHAEALLDAVSTATNLPYQVLVQGMGLTSKAVQLPDPLEARRAPVGMLMNTFGRGNRDDIDRSNEGAIAQALGFLNDPVITQRARRTGGSNLQRILASTSDPGAIADQLYLATLSRRPTPSERQIAIDFLREDNNLVQRAEDLQFVLLNTLEFLFV